jgi:hypothetical protein
VVSLTMLVPTTMLVALSVPVGLCDWTGVGVIVTTGVDCAEDCAEDWTGTVAEPLVKPLLVGVARVGVSEMVAFPEVGGTMSVLLGAAEEGDDAGDSEAGTLEGWTGVGVTVGPEETPEPDAPDGKMPDGVPLGMEGVRPDDPALGVAEGVSLGSGGVTPRLGVSEGVGTAPVPEETPVGTIPEEGTTPVGTTPDEGRTPEGIRPDEMSEMMLATMLLAGGRGAGTVALGNSDAKLDSMLGITEAGTSGTPDSRLETSAANEETSGGSTPDATGVGDGVTGAVGPADPVAKPPVIPDTREDKAPGRSRGAEGATDSEVGIAPEFRAGLVGVGDAPVPRAVVMPTTIPPDDGTTNKGAWLDGKGRPAVGETTSLGKTPVEPTSGRRTDERRPPRRPP